MTERNFEQAGLEKKDEILIFLDSSLADSTQSAVNKTFRLNPQLKINQDEECYVNLTDFHMLNSVYNVTSSNNRFVFDGTTHLVTEGFYTPTELASVLNAAYAGIEVAFNTKTLKYTITSNPPTNLFITGSLLPLLGMSNTVNSPVDTVWTSYKIPDEITSQRDILFTIQNLNTKNQMIGVRNIPNLIDKIPITVNFSEFISYTNFTMKSTRVLSNNINDLQVRLLSNKLTELEINDVSWTATLKFTIYKKPGNHYIESSLTSEDFSPVVHSLNTKEFINQRQHDLEGKRDEFWMPKPQPGRVNARALGAGIDFSKSAPNRQHGTIPTMEAPTPTGVNNSKQRGLDSKTEPPSKTPKCTPQ